MHLPDIGLMGRARSGKNTVADYLVRNYGYRQMAFADGVREVAAALNPIVSADDCGCCLMRYNDAIEAYGYEGAKDGLPEVRRLLQAIGTEAVRDVLGEDAWVDLLMQRIARADDQPIVVTDVRFWNEASALHRESFSLVRITRRQTFNPDATHPSEVELDDYPADFEIPNHGDLDTLHQQIETLLHIG